MQRHDRYLNLMFRFPFRRLRRLAPAEEGFTLVELLVGAAMGTVVMGAVALLVIGAVKSQPKISKQAENITTARWVLDRMTREIRDGIVIKEKSASLVSFEGYVRHSTCGGTALAASGTPAIRCRITYECSTTTCFRKESEAQVNGGAPQQIFTGAANGQVFSYAPNETQPTYVKITLRIPNPSGNGALTVSDGASLRNATLGY
jgi:type II secretory pathway pseudopilin PulG